MITFAIVAVIIIFQPECKHVFFSFADDPWQPAELEENGNVSTGDRGPTECEMREMTNGMDQERSGLLQYIDSNQSKSTKQKTNHIWSRFKAFTGLNDTEIVEMSPEELDLKLGNWLLGLKKSDGKDYEPGTLVAYYSCIKRKLESQSYPYDLGKDPKFRLSRKVLSSRKRELKVKGLGNLPNKAEPLTESDEKQLWEKGQFSLDEPEGLQNYVWYALTLGFGFRGSQEALQLKWGDVTIKTDNQSKLKFLEFSERLTKTRDGANNENRAFRPKIFQIQPCSDNNTQKCPVQAFENFANHRPASMLQLDSPFFLSVNHNPKQNIWYKAQPMGINMISTMMKRMCKSAGLNGKYTNHSVRKTMCGGLLHAGIHPNQIAQLSGHKNVQSLNSYAVASVEQQKTMSSILQRQRSNQGQQFSDPDLTSTRSTQICQSSYSSTSCTTLSATSVVNPGLTGGVFQHCEVKFTGNVHFNIYTNNN